MVKNIRISVLNLQFGIATTRGYWHYSTTSWKYKFPHLSKGLGRAARFLRESEVDIALLNEVGGGAARTLWIDQSEWLSKHTPLRNHEFFLTHEKGRMIKQGNAILGKYVISNVKNHKLPGKGEPRYLSEAKVDVDGQEIVLYTTHLSLNNEVREQQLERIEKIISGQKLPFLLAGDFNISHDDELELLVETPLQKTVSVPTYPSWNPTRHLDHLFMTEHFDILESSVFDSFKFSDHLPLVVDLVLNL